MRITVNFDPHETEGPRHVDLSCSDLSPRGLANLCNNISQSCDVPESEVAAEMIQDGSAEYLTEFVERLTPHSADELENIIRQARADDNFAGFVTTTKSAKTGSDQLTTWHMSTVKPHDDLLWLSNGRQIWLTDSGSANQARYWTPATRGQCDEFAISHMEAGYDVAPDLETLAMYYGAN